MAKLVDAPDLGSGGEIHVGSSPSPRTERRTHSITTLASPYWYSYSSSLRTTYPQVPADHARKVAQNVWLGNTVEILCVENCRRSVTVQRGLAWSTATFGSWSIFGTNCDGRRREDW